MSDDRLISPADAAKRLNLSVRSLERMRAAGGGPEYVKVGLRRVGYSRAACDAWARARTYPHRAAELARSIPEKKGPAAP